MVLWTWLSHGDGEETVVGAPRNTGLRQWELGCKPASELTKPRFLHWPAAPDSPRSWEPALGRRPWVTREHGSFNQCSEVSWDSAWYLQARQSVGFLRGPEISFLDGSSTAEGWACPASVLPICLGAYISFGFCIDPITLHHHITSHICCGTLPKDTRDGPPHLLCTGTPVLRTGLGI